MKQLFGVALLLLLCTVQLVSSDETEYCLPNVCSFTAKGKFSTFAEGRQIINTTTELLAKLDRVKYRYVDKFSITAGSPVPTISNTIIYRKATTKQVIHYHRGFGQCKCFSYVNPDPSSFGCGFTGNATKQGDLVKLTYRRRVEADQLVSDIYKDTLLEPLGTGKEALLHTLQTGNKVTNGTVEVSRSEGVEKYSDFKLEVEDVDFVIPPEWNCPKEEECMSDNGSKRHFSIRTFDINNPSSLHKKF